MAKAAQNHSAKQAFFYLTSFFSLGMVAVAVGALFFQIINYYFPQPTDYANMFSQSAIKFGISTLIVASPVFYFVTRVINRSISKKNLDLDSGVRRWLTYIVMFLAVATAIGDLIAVLNQFLDGTITIRFFLKALTILVIAGGIFFFYLLDMKNESEKIRNQKNTFWGLAYWVVVLIPFIWSFSVLESPSQARDRKIDDEIVSNLQTIQGTIDQFAASNSRLPSSIDELSAKPAQYFLPDLTLLKQHDFEYRRSSEREYELCAQFIRDNQSDSETGIDSWSISWKHPQGKHCFPLEVPKENIDKGALEKIITPYTPPVAESLAPSYSEPADGIDLPLPPEVPTDLIPSPPQ